MIGEMTSKANLQASISEIGALAQNAYLPLANGASATSLQTSLDNIAARNEAQMNNLGYGLGRFISNIYRHFNNRYKKLKAINFIGKEDKYGIPIFIQGTLMGWGDAKPLLMEPHLIESTDEICQVLENQSPNQQYDIVQFGGHGTGSRINFGHEHLKNYYLSINSIPKALECLPKHLSEKAIIVLHSCSTADLSSWLNGGKLDNIALAIAQYLSKTNPDVTVVAAYAHIITVKLESIEPVEPFAFSSIDDAFEHYYDSSLIFNEKVLALIEKDNKLLDEKPVPGSRSFFSFFTDEADYAKWKLDFDKNREELAKAMHYIPPEVQSSQAAKLNGFCGYLPKLMLDLSLYDYIKPILWRGFKQANLKITAAGVVYLVGSGLYFASSNTILRFFGDAVSYGGLSLVAYELYKKEKLLSRQENCSLVLAGIVLVHAAQIPLLDVNSASYLTGAGVSLVFSGLGYQYFKGWKNSSDDKVIQAPRRSPRLARWIE